MTHLYDVGDTYILLLLLLLPLLLLLLLTDALVENTGPHGLFQFQPSESRTGSESGQEAAAEG